MMNARMKIDKCRNMVHNNIDTNAIKVAARLGFGGLEVCILTQPRTLTLEVHRRQCVGEVVRELEAVYWGRHNAGLRHMALGLQPGCGAFPDRSGRDGKIRRVSSISSLPVTHSAERRFRRTRRTGKAFTDTQRPCVTQRSSHCACSFSRVIRDSRRR